MTSSPETRVYGILVEFSTVHDLVRMLLAHLLSLYSMGLVQWLPSLLLIRLRILAAVVTSDH